MKELPLLFCVLEGGRGGGGAEVGKPVGLRGFAREKKKETQGDDKLINYRTNTVYLYLLAAAWRPRPRTRAKLDPDPDPGLAPVAGPVPELAAVVAAVVAAK